MKGKELYLFAFKWEDDRDNKGRDAFIGTEEDFEDERKENIQLWERYFFDIEKRPWKEDYETNKSQIE